ncbi:UDP-phosphate N-acetylglucosaminyl-1-phosphate transferase [Komagataeibacter medellinensis]|uniref:UDP-phosphate N-acetylglucosaminyl-1-phosphate transferase n=1 Tax=Komagataeibacter medellinensis TaxID=1177712 RepID=A0ABQ6VT35_9PROT|nr:UDP-phosphate N-acetylglucosaminyl-1-phosphate transferase [Komagataeibacter medellinensis]KAB8123347.1 UDP-phosphate N-acetylglucosaminyl-1-phosphate transferase [Komagataeibacter medellinensis]
MTLVHFPQGTLLTAALLLAAATGSALLSRRVIGLHVMDYPGSRSAHAAPVPKGGGLAILIVFVTGVPLLQRVFHHHPDAADITLLAATVWLGLFCWRDDMRPMPPLWKLGAQGAAAVLVAWGGMVAAGHGVNAPGLAWRTLWLVMVCNTLNFMDGLNGLASGCTLIAALATAGICLAAQGSVQVWGTALMLATAIAGFLPFNFPRARLFMGDVGSQCCGLVLGALGLYMAQLPQLAHGGWLMPLMLCGLLADVVLTLLRRAWLRRSLMQAHREHIYQMAHRAGMQDTHITWHAWAGTLCGSLAAMAVGLHGASPVVALVVPGSMQLAWMAGVSLLVRRKSGLRW